MSQRIRSFALLGIVLGPIAVFGCRRGPAGEPPPQKKSVRVAAAATLTAAFEELGATFELGTGESVDFSFGSSGLLAKQLIDGAPFDLFASADLGFVDQVIEQGVCDPKTRAIYARGRIVLWSRAGEVAPPKRLEDLADERFRKIAIANPDHAPYGRAAREALQKVGVWDRVAGRLVYAENVRQALQLGETGNVEVAIVSLALVSGGEQHPWLLVDENLHSPLDQALAVCARGENRAGAEAFIRLLDSESGRALMRRHGFTRPDEISP